MLPGGRLLDRAGRARVVRPGQLHLLIRPAAGELAVQDAGGGRRGGGAHSLAVPRSRVPPPHRDDPPARSAARLQLRGRVRVRARPDPRRPREAPGHGLMMSNFRHYEVGFVDITPDLEINVKSTVQAVVRGAVPYGGMKKE